MSALWLTLPLSLAGTAEAFGSIGQTEFYYQQFPEKHWRVSLSLWHSRPQVV